MRFIFARSMLAAAALALAACAASVPRTPVQLSPAPAGMSAIRIAQSAEVRLPTAYTRVLASGSVWRPVGTLPQGTVYRPVDTIFTIEGRDVHEAYLVVRNGQLQGFYLVAESAYSPLSSPVQLTLGGNP